VDEASLMELFRSIIFLYVLISIENVEFGIIFFFHRHVIGYFLYLVIVFFLFFMFPPFTYI
jgi:hypothetical protein